MELREKVARSICETIDPSERCFSGKCRDEGHCKEIFAMADAAIAAMEDDWRPMETAPRDGTHIMACARYSGHVIIVRHVDRPKELSHFSWQFDGGAANFWADAALVAWRPLPPGPKEKR